MIAKKASVRLCHHLFSFYQNFLKLAAKMDMDKILLFENWPDKIIYFRVASLDLKKPLFDCHHHNLFSFDQIFLKLADKVDIDGISDELKKLARSDH